VEFRSSAIRAARVSAAKGPAVIEEVAQWEFADGQAPVESVRAFAKAKSNGYLQATCAAFPQDRLLKKIRVDAPKGQEVDFVFAHIKDSIGMDPSDFSVYCLNPEDGSEVDLSGFNKKDVLLCGAPKEAVAATQKSIVEAGIYPKRLEIGTLGTVGGLKKALGADPGRSPILFLEIDREYTTAVIVGPKGVEMARRIECGSSTLAAALRDEMSLKDEAAAQKILDSQAFDLGPMAPKLLRRLLRELQSAIGFFEVQTGSSVSELFCLKDGRSVAWLEESICELLNLAPIEIDMPALIKGDQLSFADEEVAGQVDASWIGMMSLLLELRSAEGAK